MCLKLRPVAWADHAGNKTAPALQSLWRATTRTSDANGTWCAPARLRAWLAGTMLERAWLAGTATKVKVIRPWASVEDAGG